MRLAFALVASAVANPTVPTTPTEMLDKLVDWSADILNMSLGSHERLINRWMNKYTRNAGRMKTALDRCGDDSMALDAYGDFYGPWTYDGTNPSNVLVNPVTDLTNSFHRWIDFYLFSCPAQQRHYHHNRRLSRWNDKLQSIISNL